MVSSGQKQLAIYSALVALITVATILYVVFARPDYLDRTRDGVPLLTPSVLHPHSGEALDIGILIRHYKGELEGEGSVYY